MSAATAAAFGAGQRNASRGHSSHARLIRKKTSPANRKKRKPKKTTKKLMPVAVNTSHCCGGMWRVSPKASASTMPAYGRGGGGGGEKGKEREAEGGSGGGGR